MMKAFILYAEISFSIRKKVFVFFLNDFCMLFIYLFLTTWPVGLAGD